jgi:hypothetical protein
MYINIYEPNDYPVGELMKETSNNIFLGVSKLQELVKSDLLNKRYASGMNTVQRDIKLLCNNNDWKDWVETSFADWQHLQTSSTNAMVVNHQSLNFIHYIANNTSTEVYCYGDKEWADSLIQKLRDDFTVVTSYVEWVYSSDDYSIKVPLNRDRLPISEMYPFLGDESLTDYYDRYMNSPANILLLIGPPGTGKTTFIRGLLAHRNCSAIVTYDSKILERDNFFARFIEDDAEVMVIEDSDTFLKSRSDGNTMMHRFLNVGDGLVTTKGKKMIFSTNLPSVRDVDPALVRPGRCFDIATFNLLNKQQAETLASTLGTTVIKEADKYSIAEVFSHQSERAQAAVNKRIGFI